MRVSVDGTSLWFDIDGPEMRERPTVVPSHGGPGSFDHTYFKPEFARLGEVAQVVYLDLTGHRRSGRGKPVAWSFEAAADVVCDFFDKLGIVRQVAYGHSLGGFVAMVYGAEPQARGRARVISGNA